MRSKRLFAALILALGLCAAASAQGSRAFGLRAGYGLEASYQHSFFEPHFLEVDLGVDFVGQRGFRLTGVYDFVLFHPSLTNGGEWSFYLGPGVSMGYVYNKEAVDPSFMVAACVQLGMEWLLWDHLGLSVDVRPMYGWDFAGKKAYEGGLFYGLIPSLGLRFVF